MTSLQTRLVQLEIRFEELMRRVGETEDWQRWVARGTAGLVLAAAFGRFVAWLAKG